MKQILPLLYNLGEVIHLEASTCFRQGGDYMQLPHVSQRTFDYHTPLKTKDSTDLLNEAPPAVKGYSIHHLSFFFFVFSPQLVMTFFFFL